MVAASGGGYLLVGGPFAGSDFSTLGELFVVVGNPEHDVSSRPLFQCSSKDTHFLSAANGPGHRLGCAGGR
jgi:hypothetical protein